jgi:DNA/RNA-binding domain of Phe-tRNA-synthetase-like protein
MEPHPLLRPQAFVSRLGRPLGEQPTPDWLRDLLRLDADAPLQRDEAVRAAVRDALRHGGYKPTGRGKPAAEYLVGAAESGRLGSINLAVDACNAVSLHSGLPITVVDLARASAPFRIATAGPAARYAFNPSGQEIDLAGLVCLYDSDGPCGNAVKDAQRTKTDEATERTVSIVWGVAGHERRGDEAVGWYRALLERAGAATESVAIGEA